VPASDDYLRALRALTRERGLLLILDEVQTGIGRTGKLFAFQHTGVLPDIMTLGKGLGGGAPLGALVARREICCFEHGDQGGTFNGNPLMTAIGCAVLDEVARPEFLVRVEAMGACLRARLQNLSSHHGLGEVRGRGLLLALDLRRDIASAVAASALESGLLVNAPRPGVLRFMPALTVSREEIDAMSGMLDKVLSQALIAA